jgi:hypothetical protein
MSTSWASWNLLGLCGLRRVGRPHSDLDDTGTTIGHLLASGRTESLSLERATRSRQRLEWMSSKFHEAIEEAFPIERGFFQMDVGCSLHDSVGDQFVPGCSLHDSIGDRSIPDRWHSGRGFFQQ